MQIFIQQNDIRLLSRRDGAVLIVCSGCLCRIYGCACHRRFKRNPHFLYRPHHTVHQICDRTGERTVCCQNCPVSCHQNILAAQREIGIFAQKTEEMLGMVKTQLHTKIGSSEFKDLCTRIEKCEDFSDRMEYEIAKYLNQVMDGRLSFDAKMRVTTMLNIVSELESIGDSCQNLSKTLQRKGEAQAHFTDYNYGHIDRMFQYVSEAMSNMLAVLVDLDNVTIEDLTRSYDKEREINEYRNKCRDENIENINNKLYPYSAGVFYMDVICEAEKLGDYIVNVIDAVEEQMQRTVVDEQGKPVIGELNPEKSHRQ